MAQPDFVPLEGADRVRESERMPVAKPWTTDRPGEIKRLRPPQGEGFGVPGPDQGYGLVLARRFVDKLELAENEHADDAVTGCLGVALKRAALFGRAPVIYDFELAYTLWGFLGGAPRELVKYRRGLFEGASHHYSHQREIVDRVPPGTLRMTPAQVRQKLPDWKSLIRA